MGVEVGLVVVAWCPSPWLRAPGPNFKEEWVERISATPKPPLPPATSIWFPACLEDCGWREGERQLES